ncbi:hypothetical protein GGX14DRAFT_612976 [Mycena pura]|uniref:Uncharacterized protein n=1 Tax=Mycena pura TaxID=153505 RepID=A0AAD6YTF9_9AGAR|nr:hypothetical protein GGX14DRAFT_612976 [Mycena pura]
MTTRTQTSPSPFSALSFIGRGSQAPTLRARNSARRPTRDDDYIPYNGPYEEPPRARQERNRDSWGDPVYDEEGSNMIHELHRRYVPSDQSRYPWLDQADERNGEPRSRVLSGASGHTGSSGTVDPNRSSVGLLRKSSHVTNATRPPVPSYTNFDASGGVGESPVPPGHSREAPPPPKRGSLANIFTFGQASKRLPISPAKVPLPTSPPPTSPPGNVRYTRVFGTQPERLGSGPPSIDSASDDKQQSSSYISHEEDPYHSYYNYTPAADQFGQLAMPKNATPAPHPYAYNVPQRDIHDPPPTAPIPTSQKLKFTVPPSQRFVFPQPQPQEESPAAGPHISVLKNSVSTPNLRDTLRSPNRLRKPPNVPKSKDRWLSAETWCDAVMFPRPRLKVEDAQKLLNGNSGRIVSPPGSPVFGGFSARQNPERPEGVPSRVLVHSRSMASLNADAGQSKPRTEARETPNRETPLASVAPPAIVLSAHSEKPPRPKSFAWDDLALPSPVPSLSRVLEEGQVLEYQRKKWQMQATGSFQNSRTRNLSRSRAKSLTNRGNKAPQGNINFLAARSLLGNQDLIPVLPTRHTRSASQSGANTNGTTSFNTRSSHSHSNSLAKTVSKSSHGHSRQDSWGRSALKKAAAICYPDGALSPAIETTNGLETALRGGETKVIRLADPAQIPVDTSVLSALSPWTRASPTPSATSDTRIGIALSTPPLNDNSSSERESIHLPSHPYAQGSNVSYAYHNATYSVSKSAEYAGPHPAITVAVADPQDFSSRHRLPPQASLAYHPYASKRNSYSTLVQQARADSDVPPHSKMWAQLSPGVVREILPNEIQYSPFLAESGMMPDEERDTDMYAQNRKSTVTIIDSVGLGETLASAVEEENIRDSGLGTSEDNLPDAEETAAIEAHHPYRIHRKPVQYDISHPPYMPKKSTAPNTNYTAESSLVDPSVNQHRLTPPTPPLPVYASGSSPVANSVASSPPRSPPPIGSVDDLDEFRDLFYKPNLTDEALSNLSRPISGRLTWDAASTTRTQRTGSGLTSLARQLSAEFEELRTILHRERTGSVESESSISRISGRFPRESDIQFVFTESELARSDEPERHEPSETLSAFQPSNRIPEDVESSRASSPIDGPLLDEDVHESFRVGSVGSVVTPPATSGDHRSSYTGLLAFTETEGSVPPKTEIPVSRAESDTLQPHSAAPTRSSYMTGSSLSRISNLSDFPVPPLATSKELASVETKEEPVHPKAGMSIPRVVSDNLQLHSADPTRSSYMTTSTISRISNLSDFPAPPPQHMTPAHMSLLNSYFHSRESAAEPAVPEEESTVTFIPKIGERF